jgi:Ribonuclease G/E
VKGRTIATGLHKGRKAAALIVDGQLDDLLIDPDASGPPLPGTIYRAIAARPMKGTGGQMVALPGNQSGFLRQSRAAPGQPVLVQISGYTEPGKAYQVTEKLLIKGQYAILTPTAPGINVSRQIRDAERRDALAALVADSFPTIDGVILRSASEFTPDDLITAEITTLHADWQEIEAQSADRQPALLRIGPDAHQVAISDWTTGDEDFASFADHDVDDMIAEMQSPFVHLAAETTAWIEPTRALIAVDVNTGGDTSPAAGLKANIALCRDLPRQLRCRGLGGQIVIDFAPFPKKDRRTIEQTLRSAFKGDAVDTAFAGWTPLGHMELQRKRARLPLTLR